MWIEYSISADRVIHGKNWTAYMRKKSKLTLVFDEIWSFLKQHENLKFDALYSKLEITQFKSKAYYDIQCSFDDKTIEIFQHGILPIIWIQ